ncbi:MAG: hypothetical protein G01um10145_789 [Microgenomates group bacterium Gr01-1014_5]|nr:MAG: hypothetical protein G01um10145_789 [Microgenomates group bacterium Gr01-1014_5]
MLNLKPAKVVPISSTTQQHILIADITDDILLTKEGGAAIIMRASALNFSLLSEKEQEAITYAYSAFLNSLSFAIQILVRSQKKDVTNYLNYLKEEADKQTNAKLKVLIGSYQTFVAQIVKKRNVLEKDFFIIIPFSPFELGISTTGMVNTLTRRQRSVPYPKDYVLKKAKTVLFPRRDHVIRQSGRLGIKVQQLTTEEVARLFHNIYRTDGRPIRQAQGKLENGKEVPVNV